MRAMREQARQELESLGYDELTPDMVNELVDRPVLYFRAVRLTQEFYAKDMDRLDEYISLLEKAFIVHKHLKLGPTGLHAEMETLERLLDSARRRRDHISPPKAGINTLRSDMAGKRVAIKQIANICRKNSITISSSSQSKFYCIVRAVLGSVSPDTIRAATRRR